MLCRVQGKVKIRSSLFRSYQESQHGNRKILNQEYVWGLVCLHRSCLHEAYIGCMSFLQYNYSYYSLMIEILCTRHYAKCFSYIVSLNPLERRKLQHKKVTFLRLYKTKFRESLNPDLSVFKAFHLTQLRVIPISNWLLSSPFDFIRKLGLRKTTHIEKAIQLFRH